MAVRTAYAAVAGTPLTAANLAKYPGGWLGYNQITAGAGPYTSVTDVPGLSVTVTVGTSRRIKVTAHALVYGSLGSDAHNVMIADGSNNTLSYGQSGGGSTVAGQFTMQHVEVILTPSAGSNTYKIRAQRALGTGTTTVQANPTYPAFILVEDIGPAS